MKTQARIALRLIRRHRNQMDVAERTSHSSLEGSKRWYPTPSATDVHTDATSDGTEGHQPQAI